MAVEAFPPLPDEPAPRRVRPRTISIKRLSKREIERGRQLFPETSYPRPQTRAECTQGEFAERPCPFVSCKYHLYLDVSERSGAIKLNHPGLEVDELPESCALDVADRDGVTLDEIGAIMNVVRERIRQIEAKGLAKLKALSDLAAAVELAGLEGEVRAARQAEGALHVGEVERSRMEMEASRVDRAIDGAEWAPTEA